MNEEDAIKAEAVWANRHSGSIFFMKRVAKWNENVGIYQKDGVLVAWCLRFQAGPLGALQVDERFKRNGYGVLACRAIAKKIGAKGEDVYGCVAEGNIPSVKTFEKVGFKIIDRAIWLRTKPTISFQWNENE